MIVSFNVLPNEIDNNHPPIILTRSVDETKKEITLSVKPENIPVVQGGDGCSTNVKAAQTVETKLGIKAPMSRCASHGSQGIIVDIC